MNKKADVFVTAMMAVPCMLMVSSFLSGPVSAIFGLLYILGFIDWPWYWVISPVLLELGLALIGLAVILLTLITMKLLMKMGLA
jgi:hypothetical protein